MRIESCKMHVITSQLSNEDIQTGRKYDGNMMTSNVVGVAVPVVKFHKFV